MNFKITNDHILIPPVWHGYKTFIEKELNAVYVKGQQMYKLPRNIHVMRELAFAFPELQKNSDFIAAGVNMKQTNKYFLDFKRMTDGEGNIKLRPYQRADTSYLRMLPAAGIFNEPRTGKTPTSIELMKQLGTKKNLDRCSSFADMELGEGIREVVA
jgi:hypothetical protein